ncbi:PhnE/PtxC family ABC transporter permease [Anaerorhabdus sp.]|uniref:PhnE/PtxC family ABC transporter permease n=1 Tax=Anaerorhabdus sp. TaxID=1872524 RepID=UPI002FC8469C
MTEIQLVSENIQGKKAKRYKLKNQETSDVLIKLILLIFGVLFITFLVSTTYKWDQFRPDLILTIFGSFFRFDALKISEMITISSLLVNTIFLGVLSTILAAVIAFPFGLLAASNLSSVKCSNIIKAIASFVRAVPTIIWVLIFISSYGLSATTAVVGMIFHGWAFFVKSYSESFEEVDPGVIEALKASGASWFQIITEAVLPSSSSRIIAWLAMRSEINFAVAVVVGPAIGVAGTIGSVINGYSRSGFYPGLGFSILCVFAVAFLFEILINKLRAKTIE